mmetsp:Transcript_144128/g.401565  ORF Transcript_144128/g.401565 Transcript_144128/m.401565 type:complete len:316 (-) Transcript_144128:1099-2046(-)
MCLDIPDFQVLLDLLGKDCLNRLDAVPFAKQNRTFVKGLQRCHSIVLVKVERATESRCGLQRRVCPDGPVLGNAHELATRGLQGDAAVAAPVYREALVAAGPQVVRLHGSVRAGGDKPLEPGLERVGAVVVADDLELCVSVLCISACLKERLGKLAGSPRRGLTLEVRRELLHQETVLWVLSQVLGIAREVEVITSVVAQIVKLQQAFRRQPREVRGLTEAVPGHPSRVPPTSVADTVPHEVPIPGPLRSVATGIALALTEAVPVPPSMARTSANLRVRNLLLQLRGGVPRVVKQCRQGLAVNRVVYATKAGKIR